jgi:vacuolar protein-sorting-associated protein 4
MDIIGYPDVKKKLDVALAFPQRMPSLFERTDDSQFEESTGCLLYGPPGTGKTKFAQCIAYQAKKYTLVTIRSADINGKYWGETEKNIRTIFELAEELKPVILFLDEAESAFTSRDGAVSDNTKRATTEFLIHMQRQEGVYILACSNYPYQIDIGIQRRLPSKIHVGMPNSKEKAIMLKQNLKNVLTVMTEQHYQQIGESMKNYSGSDVFDVSVLCQKEILTKICEGTFFRPCNIRKGKMVPCEASEVGAVQGTYNDFPENSISAPILTYTVVQKVVKEFNGSGNNFKPEYLEQLKMFEEKEKKPSKKQVGTEEKSL